MRVLHKRKSDCWRFSEQRCVRACTRCQRNIGGTQRWCQGGRRRRGSVVAAENTTSLIWVACLPYLLAYLPYLLVCCSVPCIAIKLGSGAPAYSSNLSVGGFGQHSMYKQGRLKVASVGSPRYSSCFSTMREDLSTWEPA